jgi:uncharacterized protein (TIGR02270 family)
MVSAPVVETVVRQHADECVSLHGTREFFTSAPHIRVPHLEGLDERLVAHFDGLTVAGNQVWACCDALLDEASAGAVFTVAVVALEQQDDVRLERLWELLRNGPATCGGIDAALLWAHRESLKGRVSSLLGSADPLRRRTGIAACAMHAVDPGLMSKNVMKDAHALPRAWALRAAGEIGQLELVTVCTSADADEDPECRFWGARSGLLLGNRNKALAAMRHMARDIGPHRASAFQLTLQAMDASAAHTLLKDLAAGCHQLRWLIRGSGIAGDPAYIPWLINHMRDGKTARVAGEAFSLISGADLSALALERPQPEDFESGPNDDPDDPNVDMDPDEGLPWPDPDKIEKWWAANASKFQKGQRYFMGAPVTREHCIEVLKNGYQRQRILAAHYLCLLDPGTPLFNTSAPAWRQQRLLARM